MKGKFTGTIDLKNKYMYMYMYAFEIPFETA